MAPARSGTSAPLRVVLADDSYLVREAITHVLSTAPEIEIVATCEDGDELRAAIEREQPDVVLTDIRMPPSGDDEGIAIARRLHETHPEVGVVVVSQYADPRYGIALLERDRTAGPTCSRSACTIARRSSPRCRRSPRATPSWTRRSSRR